ncbi:MAG: 4a-hydroxytetrahydrobiopterin dehydratase [Methanobacteriota archaeon]|nr:MAG: 4a-hydroxytetrahydrobiopterin dehydratase [Euryarchaeota archaeon]|tara:strand:+ start:40043 stop:40366 length:324 start_codon:yes stop_codon:yes gene_type:complete
MGLFEKKCIPCQGGIPPLNEDQINDYLPQINENWEVIKLHHLRREFKFDDFQKALDFVNLAGDICEKSGHHANFEFGWGFVNVLIWTHKIDGLVESDFILASKIDQL